MKNNKKKVRRLVPVGIAFEQKTLDALERVKGPMRLGPFVRILVNRGLGLQTAIDDDFTTTRTTKKKEGAGAPRLERDPAGVGGIVHHPDRSEPTQPRGLSYNG
jgi:hypothetical protein